MTSPAPAPVSWRSVRPRPARPREAAMAVVRCGVRDGIESFRKSMPAATVKITVTVRRTPVAAAPMAAVANARRLNRRLNMHLPRVERLTRLRPGGQLELDQTLPGAAILRLVFPRR